MNNNEKELEKKVERIVEKQAKKSNRTIIVILTIMLIFMTVVCGFLLVDKFNGSSKEKDDDITVNEKTDNNVNKKDDTTSTTGDNKDNVDSSNNGNVDDSGSTSTEEPIPFNFTDAAKKELNEIAGITNSICGAFGVFYQKSGYVTKLSLDEKRNVILDYYFRVEKKYDSINESSYKKVASKYGFTESFDAIFKGYEKKNGSYVLPPFGCVGPQSVSHDITYSDAGSLILTDNVTIINNEDNSTEKAKMIYTFTYETTSNGYKYVLSSVYTEKNK